MTERIFNFSAGPAVLPLPVLEEAQRDMLSLPGVGMSVMEISHRSKTFDEIFAKAESGLRELLHIPDNYKVLFLQGGASLQFSMVPMNFLPARRQCGLHHHRELGQKGAEGSKTFWRNESRSNNSRRRLYTRSRPGRTKSRPTCCIRSPNHERNHRRCRMEE